MSILAIDPGTEESGYVVLGDDDDVESKGIVPNEVMLSVVELWRDRMAVEWVVSYGKPIGASTIETIYWIGRFVQAYPRPDEVLRVPRKVVTKFICLDPSATDTNIRHALIDMYPRTGGGAIPQIGLKDNPGPLYGMSKHCWAALGLAFTARDIWLTQRMESAKAFNEVDEDALGLVAALNLQEINSLSPELLR